MYPLDSLELPPSGQAPGGFVTIETIQHMVGDFVSHLKQGYVQLPKGKWMFLMRVIGEKKKQGLISIMKLGDVVDVHFGGSLDRKLMSISIPGEVG